MSTINRADLVEGHFYVGYWGKDYQVIFQYPGNFTKKTHFLNTDGEYRWDDCCGGGGAINFRDATLEEVNKLIGEILDSRKPKWEPKVGDYVAMDYSKGDSIGYWLNSIDQRVFLITKERSVYFGGDNLFGCKQGGLMDKYMRKATKEEIDEFTGFPEINGYKAQLSENNRFLKYGCAVLKVEWFDSTSNREIRSMTLSSGIVITGGHMVRIRKALENRNIPSIKPISS